jgi:glutaminyl-peptide cyclotransferase
MPSLRTYIACGTIVLTGILIMTLSPKTSAIPEEQTGKGAAVQNPLTSPVSDTWEAGSYAPFDGEQAMKHLKTLCNIGPRISGSEGMFKQQEILKSHFEACGASVSFQKFEGKQRSQTNTVPMANMIVTWHPETKKRVMLCGHYDTRPIADQERDRNDWTKPFLSANDGTSTVAFMMELARHMKKAPKLNMGIDFVIFDGEEWMYDPKRDKFFLGSDHFAAQYRDKNTGVKYQAAILLDVFAQPNAVYQIEENSRFDAGELVEDVWAIAKELKVKEFVNQRGMEISDDHLALNRVGIKAIDIVDLSYAHWHKLSDKPENCSGESMAKVSKVISVWFQRVK